MDQLCYNCFQRSHMSINCPFPPKYSRCENCFRVCKNENDHFWACCDKSFVSEYIGDTEAQSTTLLADITFDMKSSLHFVNESKNQQVDVSGDFLPLQLNRRNGLLMGRRKNIKYYEWRPSDNHRCVINVMDSNNIVRFSARFLKNAFIINKKIRVRIDGTIEFRNEVVRDEIMTADVMLKASQDHSFDISIFAFGKNYSFEVSQNGVEYLPPDSTKLDCPICYEVLVGQNVKVTPCGHMFCTVCILESLKDSQHCPICRKNICEDTLKNIFLRIY